MYLHIIIGGRKKNNMENKVFILDQTTIKKLLTVYRLSIPDFQRSFVWKQSKKQQLLESLFRGFPIGAITLYDDNDKYYIIDGLQRINTLNQYLSRPYTVVGFPKFYDKVKSDMQSFIEKHNLSIEEKQLRKCIKIWYEKLENLYEFEKVSVLYSVFLNEKENIFGELKNLELVEELLEILKQKIEIRYDDIALIIYKGSKNDLPELFKNINTGSVALSQYEILQSVWNDYILDKELMEDTYYAFNRELELIRNDYEIESIKEAGQFDIFKNIMGLNHIICCKQNSDIVFNFSTYKKIGTPHLFEDTTQKFFENDSISFELYSTILCGSPNQIVKAIDFIYNDKSRSREISLFVSKLNEIIIDAVDFAMEKLKRQNYTMIKSKYHSLYIIAGVVLAKYDIDVFTLEIKKTPFNNRMMNIVFDLETHIKNNWFIDENRQISFFNIKIDELKDLKKGKLIRGVTYEKAAYDILELMVNGEKISGNTVKEFYGKIFEYLELNHIKYKNKIPYATGKKRYLLNWSNEHINGNVFVSPIKKYDFYIETHKSKSGALHDVFKFLNDINVEVEYVKEKK